MSYKFDRDAAVFHSQYLRLYELIFSHFEAAQQDVNRTQLNNHIIQVSRTDEHVHT